MGNPPEFLIALGILIQMTVIITLVVLLVTREVVRAVDHQNSEPIMKQISRTLIPFWMAFGVIIVYRFGSFLV